MRAKSSKTSGYTIYAVSGTNTVSFAIDFREADTKGLLGFAVERINHSTGERKYVDGYKVFESLIPNPNPNTVANTYTHPVQSFVWDDFACYDDTEYEYFFYPLKGVPKHIDRSAKSINLRIKTEKLFSGGEHDIFFNRGVASSQAYRRRFFNLTPDKITNPQMKKEALDWLSRHLDDALLKFIDNAKSGETLLGCFYEFHYEPVAEAFKKAMDRGVDVKLIVDAKKNESTDKDGNFHESFPREANLIALKSAGIPTAKSKGVVYLREAKTSNIQHNKFIVLLDKHDKAKEVWTGSTNISMGGIHGQTNVGHWVRNSSVAEQFGKYWQLLSTDPGGKEGDDKSTTLKKNNALKKEVEKLQQNIQFSDWNEIPQGITTVFSPRSGSDILETYVRMFDNAENMACVTLAFGINELFKDYLEDNTDANHISFFLLEKEDKPNSRSKKPFRPIGAKQNVYKSFGAYIEDDLYQWAKETSTRGLKLNKHVAYIHSKFMLIDPLSNDPVIVTGSANFSKASTNDNDENMIIIRGNTRVADIYYTEFNRLFNHYYFRSVYKKVLENEKSNTESMFLAKDDKWLEKYEEGKFRYKRVDMFTKMEGFE
jgi:phosphatidylserine/phosphatidylglycerophosphate/cardiolipin synthase-like enzyme